MEKNQIAEDECMQKRSFGFMEETPFLLEVVEDIERAYSWEYKSASDIFWSDDFSQCFEPGRLVVLCGDSAACNTKFLSQLVNDLVFQKLITCAVFSQNSKEFSRMQLAISSGIGTDKLLTGGLLDGDWPCLTRALGRLNEARLYLEDAQVALFESSLRRYASRCHDPIDGAGRCPVFVDGLHFDERGMVRLKALAVELQLPIFITHHFDDAALVAQHADMMLSLTSHELIAGQFWNCVFSMYLKGQALIDVMELRIGR